jgi:hypothetical protein
MRLLLALLLVACSQDGLAIRPDGGSPPDDGAAPLDGARPADGATPLDLRLCGDPAVMARYPRCTSAVDPTSCAAAGGNWTRIGLSPMPSCVCPTGQDGCPCARQGDCLSACTAPLPGGAPTTHTCDAVASGTCTPTSPWVGCWCWFDAQGSAQPICAD